MGHSREGNYKWILVFWTIKLVETLAFRPRMFHKPYVENVETIGWAYEIALQWAC